MEKTRLEVLSDLLAESLRFDNPCASETGTEKDIRFVVQQLREISSELEAWKDEGEEMFGKEKSSGILFSVGKWWGERPWFNRGE